MNGRSIYVVVRLDRPDQSPESGVGPLGAMQEEITNIVGDMQESIHIDLLKHPFYCICCTLDLIPACGWLIFVTRSLAALTLVHTALRLVR